MQKISLFPNALFALAVSCLLSAPSFAQDPSLENASFDNYIAASDSFANWSYDKDATGGQEFVISQETTGAFSAPGCLKMAITPGADTLAKCTITGSITGLTPNRIVQITGMVKYADMPTYYNAMISFDQVNCTQANNWKWNDLKWGTLWGNNPGASDWTQFTATDTVKDTANVFHLVIFQSKVGTLWVDDIAVTYTDPVIQKAVQTVRQSPIVNNRIVFPSATPYTLEAFGINGKTVLKRSATAMTVDLSRLDLPGCVYLVKVAAGGKTWSEKVLIGK